jgi:uncharacterized membrane protein
MYISIAVLAVVVNKVVLLLLLLLSSLLMSYIEVVLMKVDVATQSIVMGD